METIPIFNARIRGIDNTGIFAMSFVEDPANEKNFVALKKSVPVKLAKNKAKQILTGVVLVPDQLIYRNDTARGEHYIKFSAQDIEQISHKMMRTGLALKTTTHEHEKPLAGNYLVELWTVTDPKNDKAAALGLGELPKGTLVASYKISNAAYWRSQVEGGKVKGFSIEGLFNFNKVIMNKNVKTAAAAAKQVQAKKGSALSTFLSSIITMLDGDTAAETKDLTTVAKADETNSGEPVIIFELAEGGELEVDSEGFCTLDGEQMPAGQHALADGNTIEVDDAGLLVATVEEPAATDEATAAAALARQKAKDAGKALLAKAKQPDPNAAKIKSLEAQIAKLKAEPSTGKAVPKDADAKIDLSKMTHTQKVAHAIKLRRDAQESK